MTNVKSTKRALVSSILALFLCFAMLLGTTYAWFTDSVSSDNNIIKTGTLDVIMEYADGGKSPEGATWNDASKEAIFEHDNWEPGYASAKHIKVSNVGTLALNYQMRIVANGVVSKLADVIDVYYIRTSDKAITRDMLATAVEADKVSDDTNIIKVGTLTEVLGATYNLSKYAVGSLEVGESYVHAIVLKMQETADNEYQNMDLGCTFSVQLIATQKSSEKDSFDDQYDKVDNVPDPSIPAALVRPLYDLKIDTTGSKMGADLGEIDLDCGFQFEPTMLLTDAKKSEYRYWHADFVVSADNDVPAESMALAGYYDAWCSLNNDKWVALTAADVIPAGTEIRLVSSMADGFYVNWEELCEYGNDGIGFRCGAVDLTGENRGTTLTVELRIYETTKAWDATSGTANEETGNYITVAEFEHTFGGNYVTLEDNTVLFYADDGEVVLYDTQNVTATTYTVPADVTVLGNYSFSYNTTIEEVTLSESVTSLGRAFDSNTAIKKVTLNEGLEQIDSRAFRATAALEEVVISSTVKTIADNAFQKSAIKNIVIPATVETVGETAFGASKIETVTFEGNTSIQGYAFRGCPDLRTVYLNGDDTTFVKSTLNGRNSMWFCNGESNNPNTSDIDFYVTNSTVASRVKVAMGAEAGNTDVYINNELASIKIVNNTTALQNALNNAAEGDIICLMPGVTYDVVTISGPMAKNVTVLGAEGAVLKGMACDLPTFTTGATLYGFTLENVAFEGQGFYLTNVKNTAPWGFVENFTMIGCSFKGADQSDAIGNRLFDYGTDSPGSHQFINLKITNCTVDTAIQGIRVGALRGDCEISGNVITNVAHNAITIRSVQEGTTLVKDNVISNGSDRAFRIGANSATVNYVNNTITNTGDVEDGSNFKANTLGTVTFSGNTVDGEAWNPLA